MDTTSTRGDSHISPAQSCAPACAAYWAERRTAGKDSRSLTLFVQRSIFGQALDDGLIVRNPAAKVQASGTAPKQRQALNGGDLTTLRAHVAGDRLGAVWCLTLAGLRRSEILALTWADVDLSAGTVTVSRSISPDASGRRGAPTGTKTHSGARCLPLVGDVVALLSTFRADHAAALGFEHIRSGFLPVDENGTPLRPKRWSDMWRTHCQTAGVPVVTLHSARHSSVTALRAAGVSDDVVAAWHGHDETIMRAVYSHPSAVAMASAGRTLPDVLGGNS